MIKINNLNFHQTFPPSNDLLSRLLTDCPKGMPMTKEEISEVTGIPTGKSSGKVEPHICYAEFMGLLTDDRVDGKHQLHLTKLGEIILNEDPGINEDITLLLCHLRITSPYGGAPMWSSLFNDVLPKHGLGVKDTVLLDEMQKIFGKTVKMGPLFSSYQTFFENLNILDRQQDNTKINPLPYNTEAIYVYAYSFLYEWEQKYVDQSEITADEVEGLGVINSLGWTTNQLYAAMEEFAEREIIKFNRQLSPYTITKLKSADEILPLLYSELC